MVMMTTFVHLGKHLRCTHAHLYRHAPHVTHGRTYDTHSVRIKMPGRQACKHMCVGTVMSLAIYMYSSVPKNAAMCVLESKLILEIKMERVIMWRHTVT